MSQDPARSYKYLERRSVIPINIDYTLQEDAAYNKAREDLFKPLTRDEVKALNNNVQGDVFVMFPKRFERFIFFRIANDTDFKRRLAIFHPRITSAKVAIDNIQKIHDKSEQSKDIVSTQIAFSKAGLIVLGNNKDFGDPHFDRGPMRREKKILGDMSDWDPVFEKANEDEGPHGVILVTTKVEDTIKIQSEEIIKLFNDSIEEEFEVMDGRVREGETEFFGFRDGISQPALRGVCRPHRGQVTVDPGVVVMGYKGDPKENDHQNPKFKDGSFMVFRKLEQAVLPFEDYVDKNYKTIRRDEPRDGTFLTRNQRKDLFGARLVGRFKSGAPLALTPYRDDFQYTHPEKINDFDFTRGIDGQSPNCPFSAHIRKVVPRNLAPLVQKKYLEASMIIRSGIPYGPEVTKEEREKWKLKTIEKEIYESNRGLLFVCYQSSIDNGFFRQTVQYANNDYFPTTSINPTNHGQDPIIGGPAVFIDCLADIKGQGTIKALITNQETGKTYEVTGFAKAINQIDAAEKVEGTAAITGEGEVTVVLSNGNKEYQLAGVAKHADDSTQELKQNFFVTSRGGEYFFVPSISEVKRLAEE
jgi:Dyp-type peroxidase family